MKNYRTLASAFVGAVALILSAPLGAMAATITFDEPGVGNSGYTEDGYTLNWIWGLGQNNGHDHISGSGGNPGAYENGHGQNYQGLKIDRVDNGLIALNSIDIRGGWAVGSTHSPTLGAGNLFSMGTNGSGAWHTVFPNLIASEIYIYSIRGITGPGDLDNIVLGAGAPTAPVATPEPSTMALFATGMVGMGLWRARRNKTEQSA